MTQPDNLPGGGPPDVPPAPVPLPIDLARFRKGTMVKHADGRPMHVHGMFLSTDGPVLMMKLSPTQVVAENVPLSRVDSVIRF